jgi:hypothetical protein
VTPAQQRAKQKLAVRVIREWRDRLGLWAWKIDVEWGVEPEDDAALASVGVSNLYDQATIRFSEGWEEMDAEEFNRVIVHELLHIMFRDYGQAVRSIDVTGELSPNTKVLWHDRCHDAEEGLIDRLAWRFVEGMGAVE